MKDKTTVVVVDDERNILTSLGMALKSEGYKVRTYGDGVSALEALAEQPADIAILDIKMPRMDGMELLRRIRQMTNMPVIFLTSMDEEIDEWFGLKLGADVRVPPPHGGRWSLSAESDGSTPVAQSSHSPRHCDNGQVPGRIPVEYGQQRYARRTGWGGRTRLTEFNPALFPR